MPEMTIRKLNMLLYNIYFFLKMDYPRLFGDIRYVKAVTGRSGFDLLKDMLKCSFTKGVSFEDYNYLRFYDKSHAERDEYIGTAEMYMFQKAMNRPDSVKYFRDKNLFNEKFSDYTKRGSLNIKECTVQELESWLHEKEYFMAKPSKGTTGAGIEKLAVTDFNSGSDLLRYLKRRRLDLLEEYIYQNEQMSRLNPSSVNTVRIMTLVDKEGEVKLLGAILRIGVGKPVDNFDAGGIAAPIDLDSGNVKKYAVSKSIRNRNEYLEHPSSLEKIEGFSIPMWEEIVELVVSACHVMPEVRTVGWDIAVTEDDVLLVEGNDNWCKVLFQRSHGEGARELILGYFDEQP